MQVAARLRYARISPQKCRLVADTIRGKSVDSALKTLAFMPKKGARIVKKVLESAIASIQVDEAPSFRRYRARAKGRGARIIKRNSHITIHVADE